MGKCNGATFRGNGESLSVLLGLLAYPCVPRLDRFRPGVGTDPGEHHGTTLFFGLPPHGKSSMNLSDLIDLVEWQAGFAQEQVQPVRKVLGCGVRWKDTPVMRFCQFLEDVLQPGVLIRPDIRG